MMMMMMMMMMMIVLMMMMMMMVMVMVMMMMMMMMMMMCLGAADLAAAQERALVKGPGACQGGLQGVVHHGAPLGIQRNEPSGTEAAEGCFHPSMLSCDAFAYHVWDLRIRWKSALGYAMLHIHWNGIIDSRE